MKKKLSVTTVLAAAAVLALLFAGCSDRTGTFPGPGTEAWAEKAAASSAVTVRVLVKPGSEEIPAPVNLTAKGSLPAAILGEAGFDAQSVDPSSVLFAGAEVLRTGRGRPRASAKDVDGDGFIDLVLHFAVQDLDLADDAVTAVLTGGTFDGQAVTGSAEVRIVPRRGPPPPPPPPPLPVLWNRLGSALETEGSEIGPAGTIVGEVNFDHDVMFGKGITPNSGYAGSGVDFPPTVANPERGCVEMWTRFYSAPQWYSHGVYGLVNANHWTANVMNFSWYNGNAYGHNGFLYFDLLFNGTGCSLAYSVFDPPLDTPVHLAVVWDRSGIAGSGDYMRIYIDGSMAAAQSSSNTWGQDNTAGAFRVATTWDGSFDEDRFSVDNLKVWDFAKTDFSDRFTE
jgi:hypothetical protein